MYNIIRHEAKREGSKDVIILYLNQNNAEFSKELGSPNKNVEENLDRSVKAYINQKFPNLKNATVKVMVGSMLVTTFAFTPALGLTPSKAGAEELGTTVDGGEQPTGEGTQAQTDGGEPATGGEEPAAGGEEPAAGGEEPAAGGEEPAAGGEEPAAGGEEPVVEGEDPVAEVPAVDEEAAADTPPFTDIDALSDEKFIAIWDLHELGVINGFTDGTFRPNSVLTRGQAALMFFNTGWYPAAEGVGFPDVKNERYIDAVSAMKSEGIFQGHKSGNFGLTDQLTREQMATALVRAFGLEPIEGVDVELGDLDKVNERHRADVSTLYQHGITLGNREGNYNPTGTVNRGDFALFMHRAIMNELSPSIDTSTATVVDNGDQTATITVTVNDRAGDPISGLTAEDFSVELRDTFYTVGETGTLGGFTEVEGEEGVYTVVFSPGSAVNETVNIYVGDFLVAEDVAVVIE
jgi:hypothetical protein